MDHLLVVLAFLFVATVALLSPAQNDTWWQLAAGRETVETGRVHLIDSWSHTAFGRPWVNPEWGSEAIGYLLVRAGGLPLLTAACASLVVAAYLLVWPLMRGALEMRALLLLAFAAGSTGTWSLRGQLITMLLVVLTLRLVVAGRWLWLPLVFVAWANLHAGIALGGIVLLVAVAAAVAFDRSRLRAAILTGAACLAAGAATPFGWRYWMFLAQTIDRITANRPIDWLPPPPSGSLLIFWIVLPAFAVLVIARFRRVSSFEDAVIVITTVVMGGMAAAGQRNVPIFLVLSLAAIPRLLGPADVRRAPAKPLEPWRARLHLGFLALAAASSAALVATTWILRPSSVGWTPMSPSAARAIAACEPPLYNPYNEGAYLLWFVPSQKVFIDSRQDPYTVDFVREHVAAVLAGDYATPFRRYGIRCAVFPADSDGPSIVRAMGWRERFRDTQWVVLDRPSADAPQRLLPPVSTRSDAGASVDDGSSSVRPITSS